MYDGSLTLVQFQNTIIFSYRGFSNTMWQKILCWLPWATWLCGEYCHCMVIPNYLLCAWEFVHIIDCIVCAYLLCSVLHRLCACFLQWICWAKQNLSQPCFLVSPTLKYWFSCTGDCCFVIVEGFFSPPVLILWCNFRLQICWHLRVSCVIILILSLLFLQILAVDR